MLYSKLRLPKISPKVWLKFREFDPYLRKIIWITGADDYKKSLTLLVERIKKLWKTSNPNFAHLYLKECMRLVIRSLSGNPELKYHSGIMVKVDATGLPTIIPYDLRMLLRAYKDNQRMVVCILSILSIYRVFPTKPKPKTDSITEPFSGSTRSLDETVLKRALKDLLGNSKLHLSEPKLILMEKASPNTKKSAWGASVDAVAFLDHPRTLLN